MLRSEGWRFKANQGKKLARHHLNQPGVAEHAVISATREAVGRRIVDWGWSQEEILDPIWKQKGLSIAWVVECLSSNPSLGAILLCTTVCHSTSFQWHPNKSLTREWLQWYSTCLASMRPWVQPKYCKKKERNEGSESPPSINFYQ
jgi:hypothetical protein